MSSSISVRMSENWSSSPLGSIVLGPVKDVSKTMTNSLRLVQTLLNQSEQTLPAAKKNQASRLDILINFVLAFSNFVVVKAGTIYLKSIVPGKGKHNFDSFVSFNVMV